MDMKPLISTLLLPIFLSSSKINEFGTTEYHKHGINMAMVEGRVRIKVNYISNIST